MANDKQQRERSWFCVFNNPQDHMEELRDKTPQEICEYMGHKWQEINNTNSPCAIAYCISKDGLHHLHMVLENPNKVGFNTVKGFCNGAHIEATKGNKKQAEDYIHKRPPYEEKGEIVEHIFKLGEIQGAQGRRNELAEIDELLAQGKTPNEIFEICGLSSMRYEKIIKGAFFRHKCKEIGRVREVTINWHLGDSGTGKSHSYSIDERSDDEIYFITGPSLNTSGVFDNYYGQKVLYIDELKPGHITFGKMLVLLDKYRTPLSCRYCDGFQLWEEINITSVYTPQELYKKMFDGSNDDEKKTDMVEQLNRINTIVYHFCTDDDNIYIDNPRAYKGHKNYHTFEMPYSEFISREDLKRKALANVGAIEQGDFCNKQQDLCEFFR